MVYWESLGSRPLTVWLKYLGQAVRTWRILLASGPTTVFVMTPPVFAPLTVWAYCAVSGRRFVIDAHTAAFVHPRWRHFQWLQYWLARRAATTIVHNEHLQALIEQHGAHATIVHDMPVRFDADTRERYPLDPGAFNIAVVCSFNPDEPIAEIVEAAARLPDVLFHLTGKPPDSDGRLPSVLPPNLRLTGFLSTAAYGSLVSDADAVMALTTRDHTMLRGAWEAVYQGTPVIVSDWPVLRQAFDEGAVHVDNTPDGIVRGIDEMRTHHRDYRQAAGQLKARKEARWKATRDRLLARIA
jgi:glycosyltransferase involved in cell wall biosynthesis